MVFVTNADGSEKIGAVTYEELKADARKEARDLKKRLGEIAVVPEKEEDQVSSTPENELTAWTNTEGKTIKAIVRAKEETRVQFEMPDGKLIWYPIEKLSAESQEKLSTR